MFCLIPVETDTVDLSRVTEDIIAGYIESEKSKNKTVVAVVGDTGCGKSTFLNYLSGCKMKLYTQQEMFDKLKVTKSDGFSSSTGRVVDVAEDSAIPCVAPIGHLGQSRTFLPQLLTIGGAFFWDTAGYLDSHGVNTRISNAANLRQVFHKAKKVKVVLVMEHASFQTGRGEPVRNLVNTLRKFFGTEDVLQRYLSSILVVMTKVGRCEDDNNIFPVTALQSDLALFLGRAFPSIKSLSERLVLYDPLNRDDRLYGPNLRRDKLLDLIHTMESISCPETVFLTSLNVEESNALLNSVDELIRTVLENLEAANIAEASKHFQVMKVLQVIVKNERVNARIREVRNLVMKTMEEMEKNISWYRELNPKQRAVLTSIKHLFDENAAYDKETVDSLMMQCTDIHGFQTQFTAAAKTVFANALVVIGMGGLLIASVTGGPVALAVGVGARVSIALGMALWTHSLSLKHPS